MSRCVQIGSKDGWMVVVGAKCEIMDSFNVKNQELCTLDSDITESTCESGRFRTMGMITGSGNGW